MRYNPPVGRRRPTTLSVLALEPRTTPSNTPLPDLGPGYYQGYQGGLYPDGRHAPPAGHAAAGLAIGQNQIRPLNAAGQVDAVNGRIVMISIGMSNTTQEFGSTANSFKVRADQDNSKNPRVVIVDGAQGGQAADAWVDPAAPTWTTLQNRLANAGVAAPQVQVAWIKQADRQPHQFGAFPGHARHLQGELEPIVRNLKSLYPNVRIAYVSSRTMSYQTQPTALNPEPFAYESGFATQWMIGEQIAGAADLNYDPANGPVVAPYLKWGPYLWADGGNPRSDGFTWLPGDLQPDLTHPSPSGVLKVSDQLLAFFKTDPTAAPWFLRTAVAGQPPTATPTASATAGVAPLTVQFDAAAADADGTIRETAWTFDDGTFSRSATPTKTFVNPGTYTVRLAVVDNSGNPITRSLTIEVAPATAPPVVAATAVNGGEAQRSRLTDITVTFSAEVAFATTPAAAFTLSRVGGGAVGGFTATANVVGGVTVVTLSGFTGAETRFGSLADGRFVLTVLAGQVTAGGQPLDGDGDGQGGDDFVLTGSPANGLFSLYGDADGNGVVNAADYAAFRTAFGSSTGNPVYRDFLDFDNDGVINAFDFSQFRLRFGATVP